MRIVFKMVAAMVFAFAPLAAQAQTAPAPAHGGAPTQATPLAGTAVTAAHYTTAETDIGTLLDDPAARAILARHLPELLANDQISMARSMTLRGIQSYASDMITDAKLALIDQDLAQLPARH